MTKKMLFLLFLIFPGFLLGMPNITPKDMPWFTGPIIAPNGVTAPKGVVIWQPFLYVMNHYGIYDKHWNSKNVDDLWTIQPLIDVTYGLSSFIDIQAIMAFSYSTRGSSSSVRPNDSSLYFGFQAMRDVMGTWKPDLRITIQQIFPTGQYDKLNPKKRGTDLSGRGAYQTGVNFIFQKLFETAHERFLRLRLTLGYYFPLAVHIKGISSFGGAANTSGVAYLGQNGLGILSAEYTLTRNWVVCCDLQYTFKRADRFSGRNGTNSMGEKAKVGIPVSQQISIAPGIEYNFNANFGLLGGAWFTLAGKSTTQFFTAVFSAVISY